MSNGNDLSIYSEFASEWWQPRSPRFRSLQNLTPFRLELITEACGDLHGKTVYDLGCGGGLISIPLIERGANVTGVDLSGPSIEAARRASRGRGRFIQGDITNLDFAPASADVVLLADVLDHISDYPKALAQAHRLVRPGGKVFVGTINRTTRAFIGAILLGEGLRLIPPGTHRFSMFIRPAELRRSANQVGLSHRRTFGERLDLFATLSRWAITMRRGSSLALAYSMVFERRIDCVAN